MAIVIASQNLRLHCNANPRYWLRINEGEIIAGVVVVNVTCVIAASLWSQSTSSSSSPLPTPSPSSSSLYSYSFSVSSRSSHSSYSCHRHCHRYCICMYNATFRVQFFPFNKIYNRLFVYSYIGLYASVSINYSNRVATLSYATNVQPRYHCTAGKISCFHDASDATTVPPTVICIGRHN